MDDSSGDASYTVNTLHRVWVRSAPEASAAVLNGSGGTDMTPPATGVMVLHRGAFSDGVFALPLPFSFYMLSKNYGNGANNGIFLSSNTYIAFGHSTQVRWLGRSLMKRNLAVRTMASLRQ